MSNRVIVIGGGASGMIASIVAARHGAEVTLLEKN
ncbi:MAG: NAD(P)/FAD-dependent oxidoreductase, partial [Gudongella sp.]|nr:NAD(P)/FAD-dependent oxidoreductase [Gudongella sp.]